MAIPSSKKEARVFSGKRIDGKENTPVKTKRVYSGKRTVIKPTLGSKVGAFGKEIIKDPIKTLLVKPALQISRVAAEGIGGVAGALGHTDFQDKIIKEVRKPLTFNGGLLGSHTVAPQKAFGNGGATQIAGQAAHAASYILPFTGLPAKIGAATLPTTAKLTAANIAKARLAGYAGEGAISGSLGFGGITAEEGGTGKEIAKSAAIGAGIGFAAPLAFAGAGKALGIGSKKLPTKGVTNSPTVSNVSKKSFKETLSTDKGMYTVNEKKSLYETIIKPKLDKVGKAAPDETIVYYSGNGKKGQYVNTKPAEVWHYPVDTSLRIAKVKTNTLQSTGSEAKDAVGYRLFGDNTQPQVIQRTDPSPPSKAKLATELEEMVEDMRRNNPEMPQFEKQNNPTQIRIAREEGIDKALRVTSGQDLPTKGSNEGAYAAFLKLEAQKLTNQGDMSLANMLRATGQAHTQISKSAQIMQSAQYSGKDNIMDILHKLRTARYNQLPKGVQTKLTTNASEATEKLLKEIRNTKVTKAMLNKVFDLMKCK